MSLWATKVSHWLSDCHQTSVLNCDNSQPRTVRCLWWSEERRAAIALPSFLPSPLLELKLECSAARASSSFKVISWNFSWCFEHSFRQVSCWQHRQNIPNNISCCCTNGKFIRKSKTWDFYRNPAKHLMNQSSVTLHRMMLWFDNGLYIKYSEALAEDLNDVIGDEIVLKCFPSVCRSACSQGVPHPYNTLSEVNQWKFYHECMWRSHNIGWASKIFNRAEWKILF